MEDGRHHGEVSMESFIKHQMAVILQPLVDDVQALDSQLTLLTEHLERSDANISSTQQALKSTDIEVLDLRGALKLNKDQVTKAHDDIKVCMCNHEMAQQGLELTNSLVHDIHTELDSTTGIAKELRRSRDKQELDIDTLTADLYKMKDAVENGLKLSFDQMLVDLTDLRNGQVKMGGDADKLRVELEKKGNFLQDTRKVTDKNSSDQASLMKSFDAFTSREAHLGARIEEWKNHWSKLHPALEAVRKDSAELRQKSEHHDAVIHGLQRGNAHLNGDVETLRAAHERLVGDHQSLQQTLNTTQQGLADTRDGLGKATAFSNNLHSSLQRTDGELQTAKVRLDALESKHAGLRDDVEKQACQFADLTHEHQKSVAVTQSLYKDVEKTSEALHTACGQIDAANRNFHDLKGDLGRTSDAVNKLESASQAFAAGFTGLQKGFVETSSHLVNGGGRPQGLPKLDGSAAPAGRAGSIAARMANKGDVRRDSERDDGSTMASSRLTSATSRTGSVPPCSGNGDLTFRTGSLAPVTSSSRPGTPKGSRPETPRRSCPSGRTSPMNA